MKATGIVRRIDDLGRIVIPKEIRKQLFGNKDTDGEPMEFFIDGNDIVLKKYEDAEMRKQKEIRNTTVDEFANRMISMMPGHKQDILLIADQLKEARNE